MSMPVIKIANSTIYVSSAILDATKGPPRTLVDLKTNTDACIVAQLNIKAAQLHLNQIRLNNEIAREKFNNSK